MNKISNQACKKMMNLNSNIMNTLGFKVFHNNTFEEFYSSFNVRIFF
jgi:hypothetical protein